MSRFARSEPNLHHRFTIVRSSQDIGSCFNGNEQDIMVYNALYTVQGLFTCATIPEEPVKIQQSPGEQNNSLKTSAALPASTSPRTSNIQAAVHSMKPREKAMVAAIWKREFCLKSIRLEHNKPEQFVKCQWQSRVTVHLVYLTYRWFLAILFLATMIFSICDPGRNTKNSGLRYISKWPIYLTNWGYTVCTMQAILGAWLLTCRLIAERKPGFKTNESQMSFSYKVYWALNTTGIVMALGITVAYWLTVYDPAIHRLDALNLMVHAFNSVFMLTDLFLVAHPFRLLHCYWPFLITACYVVFSYIYHESGGTDRHERPFVYALLDWRLPKRTAASSVFGLVFVLTVHTATWFLFLIRKRIAVMIKNRTALPTYEETNHTTSKLQPPIQMDDIIC